MVYHRFPIDQFSAIEEKFELRIGNNQFTFDQIELALHNEEQQVNGLLKFENPTGWPISLISPGVMGLYAWVPRMECYHGVLGFDHAVEGYLEVDHQRMEFSGGRGYIEIDWGKAFPETWIWMQSNHFSQTATSLTASVAIIPWLGNAFAGFIVRFWQAGKLHRFASYTNSRILKLAVDEHHVQWLMRIKSHRLEIVATQAEGALLQAPTPEGMGRRIAETLNAKIHVRLVNLKSGEIEFDEEGKYAGLEAVGDLQKLIKMAL